jgi:hypothetical protein
MRAFLIAARTFGFMRVFVNSREALSAAAKFRAEPTAAG